jgi:transcriptional regulator with XRE-family HTH domain
VKNKEFDPIGAKLKELRLAKNWTQANLAKKTGISQPTIYQYEQGGRSRNEQKFLKILTALGTNRTEFFRDIDITVETNELEKRVETLEEIILKKINIMSGKM